MKILLPFFMVIFSACFSLAGDKILNGGNVIVCKDQTKKIINVELLDFFEARMNGGQLQFAMGNLTWKEHLNSLLDRWATVAPLRTKQYSQWLTTFEQESTLISGVTIPPIPDTGSIFIPVGCYIEPAGFQRNEDELFPGVKRYVINKDLWDHMDEIQKAGLVLHEIIYREAIPINHPSTFPTRFLVGLLTTTLPDNEIYFRTISQMPLLYGEYHGIKAETGKLDCAVGADGASAERCRYIQAISFDNSGRPVEFTGTMGPWADVNIGSIKFKNIKEISKDYRFRFEDGNIKSINSPYSEKLDGDFVFSKNNFSKISGFNIHLKFSEFESFDTYGSHDKTQLEFYFNRGETLPYISIASATNFLEVFCEGHLKIYSNTDAPVACFRGNSFSVFPKRSYYTLNNGQVVRNIKEIHWTSKDSNIVYTEIDTDEGYWTKKGKSWTYTSYK